MSSSTDGKEIWGRIYGAACGAYLKSSDVDRIICGKYTEFKSLLHTLRQRCDEEIERSTARGKLPVVYRVPRDEVKSEFSMNAVGDGLKRSLERDGFSVRVSADGSELQVYPHATVSCDFLNISDGAKAVMRSSSTSSSSSPAVGKGVPSAPTGSPLPTPPRPRPHPSVTAPAAANNTRYNSPRRSVATHVRFGTGSGGNYL